MDGENATSGPQPYQPYEAELTNSLISNIIGWGYARRLQILETPPFDLTTGLR
jgi:hypothetical protein